MTELKVEDKRTYETIRSWVQDHMTKLRFEITIQELQEDPNVKDLKIHKIEYLVHKEKLIEIMFVSYIYEWD